MEIKRSDRLSLIVVLLFSAGFSVGLHEVLRKSFSDFGLEGVTFVLTFQYVLIFVFAKAFPTGAPAWRVALMVVVGSIIIVTIPGTLTTAAICATVCYADLIYFVIACGWSKANCPTEKLGNGNE